MSDAETWQTWFRAADDPAVHDQLQSLCALVDHQSASRDVVCWGSGKCCRFDTYRHRLYVTGLEAAWVVLRASQHGTAGRDAPLNGAKSDPARMSLNVLPTADACPYQADRLCTIHDLRPAACRIFFCQSGDDDAQQTLYEHVQRTVKALHDAHGITYRYMEWRTALAGAAACRAR